MLGKRRLFSEGCRKMRLKAITGIVLTVLLISMLTLTFNIQRAEATEPPETEWTRTYGGTNGEEGECGVVTGDGGYALAGWTQSFGVGAWLVKVDSSGNVQWNRTYGGGQGKARSVMETGEGGYALAGARGNDFWLVKVDSSGGMEWNRTYGGTGADEAECVIETSDGGYALAGFTWSSGAGQSDFWLIKTDSNGNVQWNKTYGGVDSDRAKCVVETGDGGYALAGFGFANLVKTDASGNMLWSKTYGHVAYSVVETGDGGFALAGYKGYGACPITGVCDVDFWLVKVDSSGNMQWNKTYGGVDFDPAFSVVKTVDGGYALAGYTTSFGADGTDAWLVKTDPNGNMEWNQTYGGTSNDWARSVVQTKDRGYALAGTTYSFGAGGGDFWLIKVAGPPSNPVGGIWVPVDKFGLLAPYIGLASTILVATTATAIYVKHVKRRKKKQ